MISEIIALFTVALKMSTPIIFAALGGILSERCGIINIGLEGMMLVGALIATVTSYFTHNAWLGVIGGVIAGGVLGLLHAVLCIKFRGDQIVSGFGINMLALGLSACICEFIWKSRGASEKVTGLNPTPIPLLKDIPIIGDILGSHIPLVYLMLITVLIIHLIIYKTTLGLKIIAVGTNPKAADSLGINVFRIKYMGVIISGILAGVGGAYLSVGEVTRFRLGMSGGRGFMGLAAMIFGNWTPTGAFIGGLLFGFIYALQIRLQLSGIPIPVEFINAIPYLLTIAILAGVGIKAKPPSDYKPYVRE
jgi:simple sugar transport system permease protein